MLVQALLVLGSMLTALAIGVDASLYLMQRFQLQHALLETVRLHTRTHMQPDAFARDLKTQLKRMRLPLPLGWPHSWYAEQISPNDEDFQLFRDPHLEKQLPWPYLAINNDYQAQQYRQNSGPTTHPEHNIFTANTLQLEFYYAYRPYNPIVGALFQTLEPWARHAYTRQLLKQGLLPIKIHISHPYASHPIAWPPQLELPYHRRQQTAAATNSQPSAAAHLIPPPQSTPSIKNDKDKPRPPSVKGADSINHETNDDTDLISQNLGAGQGEPHNRGPEVDQNTISDNILDCDHPACCGG